MLRIHPNAPFTIKQCLPFCGYFRRIIPPQIQHHTSPYRKMDHIDRATSLASPTMLTKPPPSASATVWVHLIAKSGAFRIRLICMDANGSLRTSYPQNMTISSQKNIEQFCNRYCLRDVHLVEGCLWMEKHKESGLEVEERIES